MIELLFYVLRYFCQASWTETLPIYYLRCVRGKVATSKLSFPAVTRYATLNSICQLNSLLKNSRDADSNVVCLTTSSHYFCFFVPGNYWAWSMFFKQKEVWQKSYIQWSMFPCRCLCFCSCIASWSLYFNVQITLKAHLCSLCIQKQIILPNITATTFILLCTLSLAWMLSSSESNVSY